jgi:diguanylate cyclase
MAESRIYIFLAILLLVTSLYFLLKSDERRSLHSIRYRLSIAIACSLAIWVTFFLVLLNFRAVTVDRFFSLEFIVPTAVSTLLLSITQRIQKMSIDRVSTLFLFRISLLIGSFFVAFSYLSFSFYFHNPKPDLLLFGIAAIFTYCVTFLTFRLYQQLMIDKYNHHLRPSPVLYFFLAFLISNGVIGICFTFLHSYGLGEKSDYFIIEFGTLFLLISTTVLYAEKQYKFKERQLQTINERLRFLAYHDTLTKLYNRSQVMNTLEKLTEGDDPFYVCLIDLDEFKNVNDLLGHHVGDMLLVHATEQLRASVRESDLVGRIGGDEFTVIVYPDPGDDDINAILDSIVHNVSRPLLVDNTEISVTTSIGVARFPKDALSAGDLLKNADIAMYRAKREGKNMYRYYSNSLGIATFQYLQLMQELKEAIPHRELELYYQPRIKADTREIIGFEALLRWNHVRQGQLSPLMFIPLAEESGSIVQIGEWVLKQAVNQVKEWNLKYGTEFMISVNLSLGQLTNNDIVHTVRKLLNQIDFPSRLLELEITESTAMENVEHTIKVMRELHELGVKLSIDDFGTGYSSFSYLKRFQIDRIKIDRSFVRDCTQDEEDRAIIIAILSMAKHLNLKTTAEGVEYEEQLEFLLKNECEEVQGYLFYKPMRAKQLEQEIRWKMLNPQLLEQ